MRNTQFEPLEIVPINNPMGQFIHLAKPELPQLKTKTLPNGKRTYALADGRTFPSVTTVLGSQEKPWLENWRTMLGADKAAKESKRASERGDSIHKMIEHYLNNELTSEITRQYKPEYVNMFNQVRMRLNKINNIRCQEVALYSEVLGIAGRVDCIGEYEGVPAIIDFKTSTNPKDRDMIEDYYLQTTAYALMWEELTGEHIDDIVIIMSVEKGMVPLLFKEKVHKYISPLAKRIRKYHEDNK